MTTRVAATITALILDFDGVIVDTETPAFEEWRAVYRRHGQDLTLEQWQPALGTHGGFDPCADLEALTGSTLDHDRLTQEVALRHRERCFEQPLLPGVEALLTEGQALGLRRAVASSSSARWVEGWLEHHGIRGWIETVVTRDDVERVKPAPDLFLLAASRLGVAPEGCVVFEDSPNGIRAARAAGMRCVAALNALTRAISLPEVDLVVDSLAEVGLADLLRRLERAEPSRRAPANE
jgi:HAD superfamily hydrolase (TIGR01509 family)